MGEIVIHTSGDKNASREAWIEGETEGFVYDLKIGVGNTFVFLTIQSTDTAKITTESIDMKEVFEQWINQKIQNL